jgi:hypothetical protein
VENVETTVYLDADPARLELSFEDLGLNSGVWKSGETTYFWHFDDPASGTRSGGEGAAGSGDRQVIGLALRRLPPVAPSAENDFAILRLVASREGVTNREATVYLRWDGRGYRVVGLEH